MIVTTINKAEFKRMPWANGGGETTQLYSQLESDSDRILWRISMADVSTAGPFSHFDGYDRVLVLLKGHGLSLSFEDRGNCELRQRYDFAEFPGDINTFATVSDGPVQDFNVIADRSRFLPSVSIVHDGDSFSVLPTTKIVTVYSVDRDTVVEAPGGEGNSLQLGDLLVIENPEDGVWRIYGATSIVAQLASPE
jgi:environmental stress-induced protein Ves